MDVIATSRDMKRVVGIGEAIVTACPGELLVTYGLGSCIGVTFHDPVAGVSAMLHAMLPLASSDRERAGRQPCVFVDSGVLHVLATMFDLGARIERIQIRAAGASTCLDERGLFRIGERNHAVLRRILWKNGVMIAAEDVGGAVNRTLMLDTGVGVTYMKKDGVLREL